MGSCFEQPEGVKEPFATSPAYLEVYCQDPAAGNYVRPDIADFHVGMYRDLRRHEIEFHIPAGSGLCRPDPDGPPYIGVVFRVWNDPDAPSTLLLAYNDLYNPPWGFCIMLWLLVFFENPGLNTERLT